MKPLGIFHLLGRANPPSPASRFRLSSRQAMQRRTGKRGTIRQPPLFDTKRIRAYEFEFGAGGNRLGCKFQFDDGSLVFVHDSEVTPEIEQFISSLGSPTAGLRRGGAV